MSETERDRWYSSFYQEARDRLSNDERFAMRAAIAAGAASYSFGELPETYLMTCALGLLAAETDPPLPEPEPART